MNARSDYEERAAGWSAFAGLLVLIAGIVNATGGLAAIGGDDFFADAASYVFGDLETWGWIMLVMGIVQIFAAISIWSRGAFGRWVGIASASANAVAQLLFIVAFPLWSLAVFALDLIVIYGLVIYGGRDVARR